MKVSDYVVEFLRDNCTSYIFGYIGGAITHLVDSAYKCEGIRFIQVYHEQTASFAAEGYSRNTGKTGVAMATSGPGATNMITGIADAFFDSIPSIFITGQVNTFEFKYDKPIRQQGFQETDIVSIVKPITKFAVLVDKPEKIKYMLEKAFYIARHGRPGPVLLDIPLDVQRSFIDKNRIIGYCVNNSTLTDTDYSLIQNKLIDAKRPIILAGGGVIGVDAKEQLKEFAKLNDIPVVVSLMGKGAFNEHSELFMGMIGSYGNRCANMLLSNADLVLALGTRLDTRQTGTRLSSFIRKGEIIHVDIDNNELIYHRLKNRIQVNVDAKEFLIRLLQLEKLVNTNLEWKFYRESLKSKYNQTSEIKNHQINKTPYLIFDKLNQISELNDIFTVDIGQNQMFAAQMLKIRDSQKFLTSGGMASMGYSIPVAIGASFGNKSSRIFSITGDGGFHMATQALMLISQYRLPIFIIVINNSSLGMIAQFQELYFENRTFCTTKEYGYNSPDISKIADTYNIKYFKLKNFKCDIDNMLYFISNNTNGIIDIMVENTKVTPKLEVNNPIEDISPKLSRQELKANMLIDSEVDFND